MNRNLRHTGSAVRYLLPLLILSLVVSAPVAVSAKTWVQVSGGINGLAMDDINNADLRWYDDSLEGFDLPAVNSGATLILGIGNRLNEKFGLGFFYEHQYARTEGMDEDVDGVINLGADTFLGRVYFYPLRKDSYEIGLAGALGYLISNGHTEVKKGNVDYGTNDIYGTAWSIDLLLVSNIKIGGNTGLEIGAGYRFAEVSDFKVGDVPAVNANDELVSLDYTGYMFRVGVRTNFGWSQ